MQSLDSKRWQACPQGSIPCRSLLVDALTVQSVLWCLFNDFRSWGWIKCTAWSFIQYIVKIERFFFVERFSIGIHNYQIQVSYLLFSIGRRLTNKMYSMELYTVYCAKHIKIHGRILEWLKRLSTIKIFSKKCHDFVITLISVCGYIISNTITSYQGSLAILLPYETLKIVISDWKNIKKLGKLWFLIENQSLVEDLRSPPQDVNYGHFLMKLWKLWFPIEKT